MSNFVKHNESEENNLSIPGLDSEGRVYRNTSEMWESELQGDLYNSETGWYGKALSYWSKIPSTVDGVLGGMKHIHHDDIRESKAFIQSLPSHGHTRALDCGAGIGRITKHLLSSMYSSIDVMEPVEHMLNKARKELAGLPVDKYLLSSMETAQLPTNTYDLIVIQWCAIYLTDDDFVKFFSKCKNALTPNGYIFFKENCNNEVNFIVDKEDSSLTRSDKHYKELFALANVEVVKEQLQTTWPSNLLPVKMYALK